MILYNFQHVIEPSEICGSADKRYELPKVGLIWLYGMKFRELLHRCHVWNLGAI
jgi:hypothetical protein